jgi:hypothetical protein
MYDERKRNMRRPQSSLKTLAWLMLVVAVALVAFERGRSYELRQFELDNFLMSWLDGGEMATGADLFSIGARASRGTIIDRLMATGAHPVSIDARPKHPTTTRRI